jgi:hypothetical protein
MTGPRLTQRPSLGNQAKCPIWLRWPCSEKVTTVVLTCWPKWLIVWNRRSSSICTRFFRVVCALVLSAAIGLLSTPASALDWTRPILDEHGNTVPDCQS